MVVLIKVCGENCNIIHTKQLPFGQLVMKGINGVIKNKELVPVVDISKYLKEGYEDISMYFQDDCTNNIALLQELKALSNYSKVSVSPSLIEYIHDKPLNVAKAIICVLPLEIVSIEEIASLEDAISCIEEFINNTHITVTQVDDFDNDFDWGQRTPKRIYRVDIPEMEERFRKRCDINNITSTRLMLHGSPMECLYSIINRGLTLRKVSSNYNGSAYGHGLYFSRSVATAKGYANDGKYILCYETAYGKPLLAKKCLDYEMDVLNSGSDCLITGDTPSSYNIFFDDACVVLRYVIEV